MRGLQGLEGAGVMGRLGCGRARGWGGGEWGLPQGQEGKGGTWRHGEAGQGRPREEAPKEAALFPLEWGDRRSVHVGVWGLQEPCPGPSCSDAVCTLCFLLLTHK